MRKVVEWMHRKLRLRDHDVVGEVVVGPVALQNLGPIIVALHSNPGVRVEVDGSVCGCRPEDAIRDLAASIIIVVPMYKDLVVHCM